MPVNDYHKPFGQYIKKKIDASRSAHLRNLYREYNNMSQAKSLRAFIRAICGLSSYIDSKLQIWPRVLGGRVTPFSSTSHTDLKMMVLQHLDIFPRGILNPLIRVVEAASGRVPLRQSHP